MVKNDLRKKNNNNVKYCFFSDDLYASSILAEILKSVSKSLSPPGGNKDLGDEVSTRRSESSTVTPIDESFNEKILDGYIDSDQYEEKSAESNSEDDEPEHVGSSKGQKRKRNFLLFFQSQIPWKVIAKVVNVANFVQFLRNFAMFGLNIFLMCNLQIFWLQKQSDNISLQVVFAVWIGRIMKLISFSKIIKNCRICTHRKTGFSGGRCWQNSKKIMLIRIKISATINWSN